MTRGTLPLLSFPFALGIFSLTFAFLFFLTESNNPGVSTPRFFLWLTMGGLAFAIVQLGLVAAIYKAKTRWIAFLLISVLLLGFSAIAFASFGMLTAPIGLILLGLSVVKLYQHSRRGG